MDNVNFQCGQCGNLMAVNPSSLGQQVRCPNCQQVVLAPAPGDPSPPPPVEDLLETRLTMPGVSEMESIFGSPEASSDALFGDPPRGLVEVPPDPSPLIFSEPTPPPPSPIPPSHLLDPTQTFPSDGALHGSAPQAPSEPDGGAFALNPNEAAMGAESATTTLAPDALSQAIPSQAIRKPIDKGGWMIVLILVPLISYSILATIAVVYLRFHQQPHPLETIPDLEGETPGVKRVKKRVSVNFNGRQEKALPASLRTTLGQTKRIGDLEVTPTAVESRQIMFLMPGREPEPSGDECLVLHLHLKNVSKQLAFHPMDPYFVRAWREVPGETKAGMPFTYLEAGKEHFYGGAIAEDEREERNESIRGQNLDHELLPGEEMDTFVCTDPKQPIEKALARVSRPMLWRVQVRRGLVQTPNRGEVAATAVIGVQFTRDDIKRAATAQ